MINFVFLFTYICSLAPKSYFAIDFDKADGEKDQNKRSSKGVQHSTRLTYKDYKEVLYSGEPKKVENTTIRLRNDVMTTMSTKKTGLSQIFVKAFVNQDQITVTPFLRFKNK